MTHFADKPQIEVPQLYHDELEELIDSDQHWDLDMDDKSPNFESFLESGYDF
jgi:hypothetical protein